MHEPEVRVGEAVDVGQHQWQIGGGHTEPQGEGGGHFIGRYFWNPTAARAGVVGAADFEHGHFTVDVATAHRTATDEVVAAPGVVGALAVAVVGAVEVGGGEKGDLVGNAEIDGGLVEIGAPGRYPAPGNRLRVALSCGSMMPSSMGTTRIVAERWPGEKRTVPGNGW